MSSDIQYNKVLSQEERSKFNLLADKMISIFSESIDGMYELGKSYQDMNNIHHKVS